MNRILLHGLALLVAVGGPAARTAAADARDSAVRPTEVIRLFDGKSLNGFYTWMKDTQREDPRKVFRVTDGMLHVTGDGLGRTGNQQGVPRLPLRSRDQVGRAHLGQPHRSDEGFRPAGPQHRRRRRL